MSALLPLEEALARVLDTAGIPADTLEVPLLEAPLAQAEGSPAPYESFDAYAVAGYFGTELGSDERVEEVLSWIGREDRFDLAAQALRDGSLGELVETWLPYHAGVAADHDLSMVMYEGGTHVVGLGENVWNEDLTRFLIEFNYSPQMAELYAELLTSWRESGGPVAPKRKEARDIRFSRSVA